MKESKMTKPKTKRTKKKKTEDVLVASTVSNAPLQFYSNTQPPQPVAVKRTLLPHQTTSEILALRQRVETLEATIQKLEQKLAQEQ